MSPGGTRSEDLAQLLAGLYGLPWREGVATSDILASILHGELAETGWDYLFRVPVEGEIAPGPTLGPFNYLVWAGYFAAHPGGFKPAEGFYLTWQYLEEGKMNGWLKLDGDWGWQGPGSPTRPPPGMDFWALPPSGGYEPGWGPEPPPPPGDPYRPNGGLPALPGACDVLLKQWTAGGRPFALVMRNGRKYVGTVKKDGTVKYWPIYRPIVIGKNPTRRQVARAARALQGWLKTYRSVASLLGYHVQTKASQAVERRAKGK